MSMVAENLPGVGEVKKDFQQKEDGALAYRLQEQEYEDHFNANVQLRRTARHDSSVATVLQKEENQIYQEEIKQKRLKEEHDRRVAQQIHEEVSKEEQRQREMEEEGERVAMSLHDEEVARTIQEKEDKKYFKQKRREEMDAKIARQVSLEEERRMIEQKEREQQMSEQLIRQMKLEENTHPSEDSIADDEEMARRFHEEEMRRMEMERNRIAAERRKREMEDERIARQLHEQGSRSSREPSAVTQSLPPKSMHSQPTAGPPPTRSLGAQSPPPPQDHPFNPSRGSMQQQAVNVEQSLPSRAMPDTGPPKQVLNYKRAPASGSTKQKTKPKKK
ncbi:coiled-coil domain-containing protein 50-like isoform X2 [Dysidea avara]|uniref:coiled-coil domain-containing protein 50-like isoform X2 n=1 Tax=Dysidea avara TaxID=196820 RepID=UPI00332230B7